MVKRQRAQRIFGTPEQRFWPKVQRGTLDRCWPWTASMTHDGYGVFAVNGNRVPAHRFAYELLREPIPAGMVPDHLCRNRACVNPWHLEVVTQRENLHRGIGTNAAKTHCPKGHEYTPANIYSYTSSVGQVRRLCRTCRRQPLLIA